MSRPDIFTSQIIIIELYGFTLDSGSLAGMTILYNYTIILSYFSNFSKKKAEINQLKFMIFSINSLRI